MMNEDLINNITSNMEVNNSVDIPSLVVHVDEILANKNSCDILKNNQEFDVDILHILFILYKTYNTVIKITFINNLIMFKELKGDNNWQALNYACQQGDIHMVIALLKINSNLSLKNNQKKKKKNSLIIVCKSEMLILYIYYCIVSVFQEKIKTLLYYYHIKRIILNLSEYY